MKIWFTSDPHYYHANVIKYCDRPYNSVEHMNESLIANWNAVVAPEDTVYCLGDFSFAPRSVELFSQRLNGTKYLVPGNHDPIHPYNKHFKRAVKSGTLGDLKQVYRLNGWSLLSEIGETLDLPEVGLVNLNHLPYNNEDNRYVDYLPVDDGKWLICGHVHQHWKVSGKMINVGVDVWNYTPVSADEIVKIIKATSNG